MDPQSRALLETTYRALENGKSDPTFSDLLFLARSCTYLLNTYMTQRDNPLVRSREQTLPSTPETCQQIGEAPWCTIWNSHRDTPCMDSRLSLLGA
jgi:hypothetical protein